MKHSGKARKAAFRLIIRLLIVLLVVYALGLIFVLGAAFFATVGLAIIPVVIVLWVLFAFFTLYFFRDPKPQVPFGANLIIAPAHGKVDFVGTTTEPNFMGGECQRVSIFLSVIDVHVQNAPVSGRVALFDYTEGQFISALRAESAVHNENVLMGFEASEPAGLKVGVRLIAGVIARRIVPFVQQGDEVARGDRISLIQFGSRADVYLPAAARISVKVGDHVVGGETILARTE